MIEETLTSKIKPVIDKVFPGKAAKSETGPFVVYIRATTSRETDISGPAGISYPVFQLNIYDTSYKNMALLSDQLRFALDGWKQDAVLYCSVEDDFDFAADPDEDGFYCRVMRLKLTHRE